MNYEKTLELSLILWPSTIPNEDRFLESYFIVLGTGCEWINGDLVDTFEDALPLRERVDKFIDNTIRYTQNYLESNARFEVDLKNNGVTRLFDQPKKETYERLILLRYFKKNIIDTIDNDDELIKAAKLVSIYSQLTDYYKNVRSNSRSSNKLYPLSNESPIMIIPDNVNDDWLEAAKKAIIVARSKERTERDDMFLDKSEERIKELLISRIGD